MNRKRLEKFAAEAKIQPEHIKTIQFSLSRLREQGALVQIHCEGLSSVSERRATNHERGITDDDPRAKRITPGVIKTLPQEYAARFTALRENARSRLDHPFNSFAITGFAPYRYIPVKKFAGWLAGQEELEAAWAVAKEGCIGQMPAFIEQEKARFTELATKSWRSLWANRDTNESSNQIIVVDERRYSRGHEDRFTDYLVNYAIASIPNEYMINSLRLTWEVALLENETAIHRAAIVEEKAKSEAMVARKEAREQEYKDLIAESNLYKERAVRKYELEAMREAVKERLRAQLQQMPDPGVEMIEQIRTAVGGTARAVKRSLNEHGRLYKATANAVRNITDNFDDVNPGDDELEELIIRLRAAMSKNDGDYNYPAIAEALDEIDNLCNSARTARAKTYSTAASILVVD